MYTLYVLLFAVAACLMLSILVFKQKEQSKQAWIFYGLLFALSAGLYWQWGGHKALKERVLLQTIDTKLTKLVESKTLSTEQVNQTLVDLRKAAKGKPYATAKLANLYMQLGEHDTAYELFDMACLQEPSELDFCKNAVIQYSLAHQGKLNNVLRNRADSILADHRSDYAIENIIALDDYNHHQYKQAARHWNWILQHDPAISVAGSRRIERALSVALSKGEPLEQLIQIRFHSLPINIDPSANIFVSVKRVGQNMPLAARKFKGNEITEVFQLSELDCLSDAVHLPSDELLEVTVRTSGNKATVEASQLLGKSDQFMLKSTQMPIGIYLAN